jgi:hypothetical protein
MSDNIRKRTPEEEQVAQSTAPHLQKQKSSPGPMPTRTQVAQSTAPNLQKPTISVETSKSYVKPLIAELIGTFAFVFIGAGSIITNTLTRGAIGTLGIALVLIGVSVPHLLDSALTLIGQTTSGAALFVAGLTVADYASHRLLPDWRSMRRPLASSSPSLAKHISSQRFRVRR